MFCSGRVGGGGEGSDHLPNPHTDQARLILFLTLAEGKIPQAPVSDYDDMPDLVPANENDDRMPPLEPVDVPKPRQPDQSTTTGPAPAPPRPPKSAKPPPAPVDHAEKENLMPEVETADDDETSSMPDLERALGSDDDIPELEPVQPDHNHDSPPEPDPVPLDDPDEMPPLVSATSTKHDPDPQEDDDRDAYGDHYDDDDDEGYYHYGGDSDEYDDPRAKQQMHNAAKELAKFKAKQAQEKKQALLRERKWAELQGGESRKLVKEKEKVSKNPIKAESIDTS